MFMNNKFSCSCLTMNSLLFPNVNKLLIKKFRMRSRENAKININRASMIINSINSKLILRF